MNVEADDAGRLRAFRQRFGRGWDARTVTEKETEDKEQDGGEFEEEQDGDLLDLITGYGQEAEKGGTAKGVPRGKEKKVKGEGDER